MSQNKTIVPGMEPGGSYGKDQSTEFYSRSTNARGISKGTVVPGMENNRSNGRPSHAQSFSNQQPRNKHGKPVFGFLYSISRQGIGEYCPLYLGQNIIGSSPKCDICLREGTVSNEHAVIVVRNMKNPEKTIASISDARSTNGTMVNGVSLGFSPMECFNGDIITVGENYELVLFLIDIKALGLKVAENFISLDDSAEDDFIDEPDPYSPDYTQGNNNYPPHFEGSHGTYNPYNGTDGTVGMDGSGNIKPGGTIGM